MSRLLVSGIAAGLIGGALLFSGPAPASAATLSGSALAAPGETVVIQEVQDRRQRQARRSGGDRRHERRYDRRRHGDRHSRWSPRFRHYHGGYYYSSPWWLVGPSIGFALTVPGYSGYAGSDAHVEWCLNRYRSYDPSSDTFLGYDGYRHRCNSPYR